MAVKFTYYGGMCVLVERSDGFKMLFDPYLSKNPQATVKPEVFYDVDMVFVTHNANDHYGDATEILANSNAILFSGSEVAVRAKEEGVDLPKSRKIGTCFGDERRIDDLTTVHTVLAVHHSKMEHGPEILYYAPAFGFVVQIEPGITYYHAGDTQLYSDMKLLRELYKPNVMAVGISRIRPTVPCEMPPREAALATSWVSPEVVIPTHYTPGSVDLNQFIDYVRLTVPHVIVKDALNKTFVCEPFTVRDC